MAKRTLYRAASRKDAFLDVGSHWAEDRDAASAYKSNPGFGGPALYSARISWRSGDVLDLAGERDEIESLAEALFDNENIARDHREPMDLADEWKRRGFEHVFQVVENNGNVRDALERKYKWVRYTDDFPEGAVTWRNLSDESSGDTATRADIIRAHGKTYRKAHSVGAQSAGRRAAARRPVSVGPRGGRYIVTPSGKKFYIARVGGRLVVKKA